jgi:hypothetical protein
MKKIPEQALTKLANAAFRQAAREVIRRAKESGTPVIVWEEGQIRERTAEEMERKVDTPRRTPPRSAPKGRNKPARGNAPGAEGPSRSKP